MTKIEQSLSPREDKRLLPAFVAVFCEAGSAPEERLKIFESTGNYMLYFEGFTLRPSMHDDDEEASCFFHDLLTAQQDVIAGERAARNWRRLGISGYCSKQHYGTSAAGPILRTSVLIRQGSTA